MAPSAVDLDTSNFTETKFSESGWYSEYPATLYERIPHKCFIRIAKCISSDTKEPGTQIPTSFHRKAVQWSRYLKDDISEACQTGYRCLNERYMNEKKEMCRDVSAMTSQCLCCLAT